MKAVLVPRRPTEPSRTIARVPMKKPGTHLLLHADIVLWVFAPGDLFEDADMPSVVLVESEAVAMPVRPAAAPPIVPACASARHNGRGESVLAIVVRPASLAATG